MVTISHRCLCLLIFAIYVISPMIHVCFAGDPQVTITYPEKTCPQDDPLCNTYGLKDKVILNGSAVDGSGMSIPGDALTWSSTKDGDLGKGTKIETALTAGTHKISLAVSINGIYYVDSITIRVENQPPEVRINSPSIGSTYGVGETIIFEGTATDKEDGSIPGPSNTSLMWYSNKESKRLGSGTSIRINRLIEGTHTISLVATDSNGATGSDSIQISISTGQTPAEGVPPGTAVITFPLKKCPDYDTYCNSFDEDDRITFIGMAANSKGFAITGDSLEWASNRDGVLGKGSRVMASLTTGTHSISLSANSAGEVYVDYVTVYVGNTPPKAKISRPLTGAKFAAGEAVVFEGFASDREDGPIPEATYTSLEWYSSKDIKRIGKGSYFITNTLTEGVHIVTMIASDRDRTTGSDAVTITIGDPDGPPEPTPDEQNKPPVVTIKTPAHICPESNPNCKTFNVGENIIFEGTAYDPEDGQIPTARGTSLDWYSNVDGRLDRQPFMINKRLSVGTHIISLVATDSKRTTGSDSIVISVVNQGGNSKPTATITSPANNSMYGIGEYVMFEGFGFDGEDGPIPDSTGTKLTWYSSIGGVLNEKMSFNSRNLTEGRHIITLVATDREDATGSTFITIQIGSNIPKVNITRPASGEEFIEGQAIVCEGRAMDGTGSPISGKSLAWYTSFGSQGTGGAFVANNAPVGTHTITLIATDAKGVSGSASVTVIVKALTPDATEANKPPVVTITNASGSNTLVKGATLTLEGSATDPEEGLLSPASLIWYSSIDGKESKGAIYKASSLQEGTYVISLTTADSEGLRGGASITINVTDLSGNTDGNSAPEATITNHSNATVFASGDTLILEGSGIDPEEGPLSGESLTWYSSINGQTSTGSIYTATNLPKGQYIISFSVMDSQGLSGSDSIAISVKSGEISGKDNKPPVATITSPTATSTYKVGDSIVFEGKGEDPEEGILTGNSLVWVSDKSGVIGIGPIFTKKSLPPGTHSITLIATDSIGAKGMAFVEGNLTITGDSGSNGNDGSNGTGCAEVILADAGEDQTVGENAMVLLSAGKSCTDSSEIVVYSWYQISGTTVILSDPHAPQVSFTTPKVGTNGAVLVFQLLVQDRRGYKDTDEVIVNVTWANQPPIANAGFDWAINEGDGVSLDGSLSYDPNSDPIVYQWVQTSGPRVTLSNPRVAKPSFTAPYVDAKGGQMVFELAVSDSFGLQAKDTVIISINDIGASDDSASKKGGGGGGCFITTTLNETQPTNPLLIISGMISLLIMILFFQINFFNPTLRKKIFVFFLKKSSWAVDSYVQREVDKKNRKF